MNKNNKYSILSFIIPLMALFSVYFYLKIILDLNLNGFGSDFTEQHLPLYDYIRQSFYMTHDLFPQMNMRHGGISSFANLVYYGSMNPFIWFSFLFPFISMQTYLELIMIPFIAFISFMNFNILKYHFKDEKINLITAIAFSVVPVILTHMQFQYAFIWFYPFFLISMWAIQKFETRYIYFMLSFSMVFYFNLQFAFATCFFLFLYMNYVYFEKQLVKKTYFKYFMLFVYANIVALMIGFLPFIVQGLASNARSVGTPIDMLTLYQLPYMFVTNSTISFGYQWGLYLYAVVAFCALLFYKKSNFYLFILFLVAAFIIGPIMYFLNMFLYIDIKVFIYYIPIMMLLFAYVMNQIVKRNLITKVTFMLMINLFISLIIIINSDVMMNRDIINLLIVQNIVITAILFFRNELYIILITMLVVMLSFYNTNAYTSVEYISPTTECQLKSDLTRQISSDLINNPVCQYDMLMTEYTSIFSEELSSFKQENLNDITTPIFILYDNEIEYDIERQVLSIGEDVDPYIYGVTDEYIYQNDLTSFNNIDMMTHVENSTSTQVYETTYDDYISSEQINLSAGETYLIDGSVYCTDVYEMKIENTGIISVDGTNYQTGANFHSNGCDENGIIEITATTDVIISSVNIEGYSIEELKTNKYPITEPTNVDIEYNESITFNLNMESAGMMVTTIPYDDGFNVKVDGVEVNPKVVNHYFLGVPLEAGNHTIEITFTMKGFYVGLFVTVSGIIVTLYLLYKKEYKC